MYSALLSVLFLGMVPAVSSTPEVADVPLPAVAPIVQELAIDDRLSASGVVILDMQSGQMVYQRQKSLRRPMASLTKLMTAIVIAENHSLDEVVTIPYDAVRVPGNRAYLPAGEQFRVGDLLSALLIASANDAAQALALFHSETVDDFVAKMNERAASLGLTSTAFANPSGLDHPKQWSTARDITWLTAFAMSNPDLAERMSRRGQRVWSLQGTPIYLTHTHALMHANTKVEAGKTGTTDAANECLSSIVKQRDRQYLVVLLNSLGRYNDMQKILDALVDPAEVAGEPEEVGNVVARGE